MVGLHFGVASRKRKLQRIQSNRRRCFNVVPFIFPHFILQLVDSDAEAHRQLIDAGEHKLMYGAWCLVPDV